MHIYKCFQFTVVQNPDPKCGSILERGLSKSEQDTVVRLHNEMRAKVANGKESKGRGGPQPSAANMMELVWSSLLGIPNQAQFPWIIQLSRSFKAQ